MKRLFFVFFICLTILSQAQDYELKGLIYGSKDQTLFLYSLYGDRVQVLDSAKTSDIGQFKFLFKPDIAKGLYRLKITDKKFVDIIINKEDIELRTDISDPFNNLTFITSEENKIYLHYIQKRNYDQYRLELLQPVISYYPMNDPFFHTLLSKFLNIQDSLNQYIDNTIQNHPDKFVSQLISIDRRPNLDPTKNQQSQLEFAKKHFFDGKDFSDTSLLHTNVLTSTILSYLALYQDEKSDKAQMEKEFIKAVDIILPAMSKNKKIYEFVIEYLIGGFDQFGFTKVMTHIASKSLVEESCENDDLKHRINTLKNLAPGNKAPEINTENTRLSDINKKYTLVVFYASWCPFCNELLPDLKTFYKDHKNELEVLSVSIDTSKHEYRKYIEEEKFEWINYCDFKGWDTKAAIDYGVYVTPNLFLLDKEKRIIARPTNIQELLISLEK